MIRGFLFTGVYYALSVIYVLASLPFLALPGRGPVTAIIRSYTRAINIALHWIGGIKKEVRGREHLPDGAFILAPKHASWGDGFLVYPEIKNLAFVTGDHLERFPLVGGHRHRHVWWRRAQSCLVECRHVPCERRRPSRPDLS
jgi:1-acyl-sn-glycerol-3-phosphate acyltransferase